MFNHLQIYDTRERSLVGIADAGLTLVEGVTGLVARRPAAGPVAEPRRVLLLRLERIGDLMMSVPAIRAVRELAAHANIHLAVGSWNGALARAIPGIDGVDILDAPWLARGGAASRRGAIEHARGWRRGQYDLAINFEGDIRSHLLMRLSGARRRIGFDMAGGGPVLTDRIAFDPNAHIAANALRLVAHAFGKPFEALEEQWLAPARAGRARIVIPEAARERARSRLNAARRPLVGVQVGGGRAIKQWPPDRFGQVAADLARRHDATIVFTGAASDRPMIAAAQTLLPDGARVIDVTDTGNLVDVAAILQHLDVLVTGDTGPMHLADAAGTPVVGVFGLTTPVRWGPLSRYSQVVRIDLACSPCNRVRRPPERCVGIVPDCLSGISAESVAAAASTVLMRAIPLERM